MKPVIDPNKEKVTIRAECRAGEGRKHVEKVEIPTHSIDTVKYIERKLADKGVHRQERHPADGLPLKHDPKKGHGGKYTWEGPVTEAEAEMEAPPAIDEKDPNYEEEDQAVEGEDEEVKDLVVGEVEVAKAAEEGVARVEVEPHLKVN